MFYAAFAVVFYSIGFFAGCWWHANRMAARDDEAAARNGR